MSTAAMSFAGTLPASPRPSKPALALVVLAHAAGLFVLAHVIDAHRVALRPPLIVQVLPVPEPEAKPPLPEKAPEPPPRKQELPPLPEKPPVPEPEQLPVPKLEEPLPLPEEPPPLKPDVLPQPLPQADMPLPPEPVAPRREMPRPVAQKPVPAPEAPARPVLAPAEPPRERPPPQVRPSQAPAPVQAPRPPDPLLAVQRDVPDAPLAPVAPRAQARVAPVQAPRRVAPANVPAPAAVAEPQPQVSFQPEPPAGASTEVTDEIALGAQLLNANYLRNPKPLYPGISKRLGEQGTVLLRVFVSAQGQVSQVTIKASSGHARLDQSAKQAVIDWKFAPATREGKPVDAWVIVPIRFSLNAN